MLVEPFTDELIKVNRAIRMSSDKTIKKAKDRILRNLRCGLSDSEKKEPYSEADFFTYKFVSKALLVERSGRLQPLSLRFARLPGQSAHRTFHDSDCACRLVDHQDKSRTRLFCASSRLSRSTQNKRQAFACHCFGGAYEARTRSLHLKPLKRKEEKAWLLVVNQKVNHHIKSLSISPIFNINCSFVKSSCEGLQNEFGI